MRPIQCAALASITFIASVAIADEEVVVVTATRIERPVSDVGQAITVIEQEAIASRQNSTIVDVLRTVPGVAVTRNGGVGGTAAVFIRGAESDHTVVLIDGVKLNDPAAPGGGFNFGNLLVGNIARVEVLRGAQSVVWGSQAIGGVVNLTTLQPTDELSITSRMEYGANDTRQFVANAAERIGRVAASIGVSDFKTDGISAFSARRGGKEDDAYSNTGAHANFDIDLTDAVSLDLRGWWSRSKAGIDGYAPPTYAFGDTDEYTRTRELVGYSGLNFALLEGRFRNRVGYAYTETQRGNYDPASTPLKTFDSTGRNARLEYQGTFDINAQLQTTFGLESEDSKVIASGFGAPATRADARIKSGYAELIAKPTNGFTAIVGLRRDDHDEFGSHSSLGGSIAWSPGKGKSTLRASYSEGFKAPSLYQLYSDYGNLQLRPETAEGWDLGAARRFLDDKLEIGLTYFNRDTTNLINFIACSTPFSGICAGRPYGTYDNVARARARGVEASLALRPMTGLTVSANYSNVEAESRSTGSANFGNVLARRPRESASALLDYHWQAGLETGLTYTAVGHSFDDAANTQVLAHHELVDLRLALPLTEKILLQARVENLFDEHYETTASYGTIGRAVYVGVRLGN